MPLDHFQTTDCGNHVHPDYALAVRMQEDDQKDRTGVRVTHGLGCPRRAAIQNVENYAVDPTDCNAALTGTSWHAMMEKAGPPDKCEVVVCGELGGVQVSGKMDRIRDGVIEDWKHIGDFSLKYKKEDGVSPEHVVQASIYSALMSQSGLGRAQRCRIWYHTSKNGKDALTPMEAPIMDTLDALEHRPYDGEYKVIELYRQMADIKDWREMPLAGQTMRFGAKIMCDFCQVREICTEAETGAPF